MNATTDNSSGSSTGSRGDSDVFSVVLAAGCTLTAAATPAVIARFQMQLLDPAGQQLAFSAGGTAQTQTLQATNNGTGPVTVYVRVAQTIGCGTGPVHGVYQLALGQSQPPRWLAAQCLAACNGPLRRPPRQISTLVPSSTNLLVGRFKKSAAAAALRCMLANSFSRHIAMPPPNVGTTVSRLRK